MSSRTAVTEKMEKIRQSSVYPSPSRFWTQIWSFVLGTGSAWIAIALAFTWWRIPSFPFDGISAQAIGTAMAFLAIPVWLNFGVHEAAYWVMMKYYADYDRVFFTTTGAAIAANLIAIVWVGLLIVLELVGVDIVGGIQTTLQGLVSLDAGTVRLLTIAGISISPGGVYFLGKSGIRKYTDEGSVVGPLTNFIIGVGLFWYFGMQLPPITFEAFWPGTLALTMYLAFFLAVLNALPFPGTDGYHTLRARDVETTALNITIIIASTAILMGAI